MTNCTAILFRVPDIDKFGLFGWLFPGDHIAVGSFPPTQLPVARNLRVEIDIPSVRHRFLWSGVGALKRNLFSCDNDVSCDVSKKLFPLADLHRSCFDSQCRFLDGDMSGLPNPRASISA